MIQNTKAENLTGLCQFLVNAEIGFARLWFTGRVIVREDYRCRAVGDDIRKHLARMNGTFVEKANRNHALRNDFVGAVQGDTDEVFLLFSGNVGQER